LAVGLFIPCYVDQLRPEVGLATLDVLESLGCRPEYPRTQTCCGQPFLTAGLTRESSRLAARFVEVFAGYDAVVTPSGSCAATVRRHLASQVDDPRAPALAARTHELCEFIVDRLGVESLGGRFEARIGLHASCHALRELGLGRPSERMGGGRDDPARVLLASIEGVSFALPSRPDECCGFGGVFAFGEESVSCSMGRDRVAAHRAAGADLISSTDVSCLIHLDGIARHAGRPIRTLHVAEVMAARQFR
jgi:L-lactate dehydrogenase complex protein LldE